MLNMEPFKDYIQSIDCVAFTLLIGPIVAVTIFGILLVAKSKMSAVNKNLFEDSSSTYLKESIPKSRKKSKKLQNPSRKQNCKTMKMVPIQSIVKEMKENCNPNRLKKKSANDIPKQNKLPPPEVIKATTSDRKILMPINHDNNSSERNVPVRNFLASSFIIRPKNSSNLLREYNFPNKRYTQHMKKKSAVAPLRQFVKLNMSEQELQQQLKRYVIEPHLLGMYGFPVESAFYQGYVEIYKCLPKHLAEEAVSQDNQRHHRHIYGRKKFNLNSTWSHTQQLHGSTPSDSGHSSGESSSSELGEDDLISPVMAFYTPDGVCQIFPEYCTSMDKQCVRCSKMFVVNDNGEYLSFDTCTYHWGKLSEVYDGKNYINTYSCCQGAKLSEGCSKHPLHVWNGVVDGLNGPYSGFLHTKHNTNSQKHCKIYALDCEMSYTGLGLEVTKVTVVGFNGSVVYEHFVRPQAKIVDYNTRFSGVSEKDFLPNSNRYIKSFAEVQKDLLNLFDSETIIVGHGLENDLKALRLIHKTVVDTSVIFSHSTGYPYKRSLKNLTKSFLKRDIQCGDSGHNSLEDSQACLELMMWKIRKDLQH